MSKEKMEQVIKETYTPDRYYKLFLYWWQWLARDLYLLKLFLIGLIYPMIFLIMK